MKANANKEDAAKAKQRTIAIKPKRFDADLPYDHVRPKSSNLKSLNARIDLLYRSTEPANNDFMEEVSATGKQ